MGLGRLLRKKPPGPRCEQDVFQLQAQKQLRHDDSAH
nr:MAG TPA: hypothetical protein [Caudoviricetes sp.]